MNVKNEYRCFYYCDVKKRFAWGSWWPFSDSNSIHVWYLDIVIESGLIDIETR